MFSLRKVKSFTFLRIRPTSIRVIFLVAKNHALSEVQRLDFYSLLKHQLTRDNNFALIRPCGNEMYKVEKSKENT